MASVDGEFDASDVANQAKAVVDRIGEEIGRIDTTLEQIRHFRTLVGQRPIFTSEEREKLASVEEEKKALREAKTEEMRVKLDIYESKILEIQKRIEERQDVIDDDLVSQLLEDNEELMDMIVTGQAELALELQKSSRSIHGEP